MPSTPDAELAALPPFVDADGGTGRDPVVINQIYGASSNALTSGFPATAGCPKMKTVVEHQFLAGAQNVGAGDLEAAHERTGVPCVMAPCVNVGAVPGLYHVAVSLLDGKNCRKRASTWLRGGAVPRAEKSSINPRRTPPASGITHPW